MGTPLRVLIVEDSGNDALLLLRELERGGYEVTSERVDTPEAMTAALEASEWDIVISDYKMPRFNGLAALKLVQEKGLDVPFILVSGTVGEEVAVEAMKAGAHDYAMKGNLARLVPAVERELREVEVRRGHRRAEEGRKHKSRDLKYIARTALEFAAFPLEEDIYAHIAKRLKELVGDAIVFVSSFDEASGTIQCRAVDGLGKLSQMVLKLIGRDPVGMLFPISEEAYRELRRGKFAKVPGGVHTLALGQIPEKACKAIEKLLGVGGIYAIGIAREGRLLGNASIVTRSTGEPKNTTLIETFINQASVALQRKLAQDALLNAAQEWRTTFDTIGDAISVMDGGGKIVRCNRAMADLLGKPFAEILGRPCHELIHNASTFVEGCPFVDMKRTRRREGATLEAGGRWFEVAVDPLSDDDGNVAGAVHIMTDVTERKAAEEKERQKARDLQFLSRTALEFAAFPPEGNIYEHIAERLKELVGDAVVLISSYEAASNAVEIRSVVGLGKLTKRVLKLLGKNLVGMRFAVLEDMEPLLKRGELIKLSGQMHELAQDQLSQKALKAAAKLLGIGDVYSLGMAREGRLFASATILASPVAEFENTPTFEAFANQASVALQRMVAEERDRRKARDLEYLSRTALEFAALAPERDIYEHIAKRLKELTGDSIVFVDSFDESSGLVEIRSMVGLGEFTHAALELIGRSPVGMRFRVLKEQGRLLRQGGLVNFKKGMYELAQGQIPERVCSALEMLVGIGDIYSIGFAREGRLFAHASMLTRRGSELENRAVIETFANQASVALQRRRAQEALRESEKRYRDLVENIADLVQSVAPDGSLIYANRAWRETLGYEEEEIPGLSLFEIIHPDSMEHCREMFQRVIAGEEVKDIEAKFLTKDGGALFVEGSASCRLVDGEPVATHGIFHDVTERKRAEEEKAKAQTYLQSSLASAPDGVLLLDKQARFSYVNPTFLEWLGRRAEDFIGKTVREISPPMMSPETTKIIAQRARRRVKTGEPIVGAEVEIVGKGGRPIPISYSASGIKDEEGDILGEVVFLSDITDRKRAEEELRQRTRELGERVKELDCLYSASTLMAELDKPLDRVLQSVVRLIPPGWQYPDATCARITFEGQESKTGNFEETPWRLAADVRISGEKAGAVEVCYLDERPAAHEGPFQEEERALVDAIAREIGRFVERRRAEEELRKSEERYRALVSNIPGAVYRAERNPEKWTIHFFSDSIEDILGYPGSDFVGDKVRTYASVIHPDDAPTVDETVLDCVGRHVPFELEYRVLCADGSVRWVRDRGQGVFEDGELRWLDGVVHDITDRKRTQDALRTSEEKYRNVVERANDGIVIIQDGVVRYTNARLTEMAGHAAEDVVGSQFIGYLDESERPRVMDYYRKRMAGQDVPSVYETALRHKNGEKVFVEINAGITTYDGKPADLVFIRDITEHRQLEAQLLQAQKMEAVGRLAGGIAHDFNNLMTVVTGYSDLALKTLDEDAPLRKDIEAMKRAGERAAGLTRQLLAFSRRQIIQPKALDVNVVVAGMGKMLRRLIGEDIDLVTVLEAGQGLVRADPGQLEQVVMNLAVNARDAMPEGGKLTVETRNAELDEEYARGNPEIEPGRYVLLAISDTGCGMDEETRPRVFEPFFTTKAEGKGTGLGLSTVYGIVKQHNGHIAVYSEPGRGTTFKVYLPGREEAVEEKQVKVAPAEAFRGTETILLVEDEEVVRRVSSRMLKLQGYTVLEASNGKEALRVCEKHKRTIHLVITDVVMPGMSGRELADRVTELYPEIKVLYMSGYTDEAITHHGVLEPGTPFVGKPFAPDDLARKLREVLDAD